jgi:hypothetical protein
MSKVITENELLLILAKMILTEEVIPEAGTYARFLANIGEVVANYCGGECLTVSAPLIEDGRGSNGKWCVHFRHTESVPSDGGVYADVDTDVSIDEWRESVMQEETCAIQ